MKCPFCGYTESKVIDSRPAEEGATIRRRRECLACQKRFTTYEIIERLPLVVVKRDGSRQSFDKVKLINGMVRACEKRPVTLSQLESIADDMKKFDKVKLIIESQTNQRVKRVKDLRDKIKSRVDENSKVSRLDYVKSLTNLGASTEVGFKTDLNMTLAEYSALLNLYKEKQKQYEQIKQRHNHKR